MKRLFFAFCLAVLAIPALHAQELTKEDRAKAIEYLEKTRAGVLAAMSDTPLDPPGYSSSDGDNLLGDLRRRLDALKKRMQAYRDEMEASGLSGRSDPGETPD